MSVSVLALCDVEMFPEKNMIKDHHQKRAWSTWLLVVLLIQFCASKVKKMLSKVCS